MASRTSFRDPRPSPASNAALTAWNRARVRRPLLAIAVPIPVFRSSQSQSASHDPSCSPFFPSHASPPAIPLPSATRRPVNPPPAALATIFRTRRPAAFAFRTPPPTAATTALPASTGSTPAGSGRGPGGGTATFPFGVAAAAGGGVWGGPRTGFFARSRPRACRCTRARCRWYAASDSTRPPLDFHVPLPCRSHFTGSRNS